MLKMHDIDGQVSYGKGKPEHTFRHGGWRAYPFRYAKASYRTLMDTTQYETTKFFATLPELEAFVSDLLLESVLADG